VIHGFLSSGGSFLRDLLLTRAVIARRKGFLYELGLEIRSALSEDRWE
jgi:hypothetical protein